MIPGAWLQARSFSCCKPRGSVQGSRLDSGVLEEGNITSVLPETPLTCLDTPNTSEPITFGQDGSREMPVS